MKILKLCCCLIAAAALVGCSMFKGGTTSSQQSSSSSQSSMNSSETSSQDSSSSSETAMTTVQDYLDYLGENNYTFENVQSAQIDDFNAVEGSTFMHNGSTLYLYRFDLADERMQEYLQNASDTGKMKVSRDGEEIEMNALVNGYYALLYPDDYEIGDLKDVFGGYDTKMTGN